MKIYQRLEQLLRFRIYSNSEIPEYLARMASMGKIDDVKKIALFNLILTVLGEIEDRYEEKSNFNITVPNPPPSTSASTVNVESFKCPDCDMVAKSQLGLSSHIRNKHKNVV